MLVLAVVSGTSVYGQSNATGSLYGKANAGAAVTAENLETGFKRSITASGEGAYRITALPPGTYRVSYTDSAGNAQTKEVDVHIGAGTNVGTVDDVIVAEKFVVSGMSINPVDFGSTEAVTVFNEKQFDVLPIGRNPTSIALLAPGTTLGDTAFGNLVSFGGASVAENAYFVNGMNISNFRNGLDPATVPFEFYNQFEIKTGAYSAEFGRSTGGVINATTKSGTNEYKAGFNIYHTPNSGRWNAPSSYFVNDDGIMTPLAYNGRDYSQETNANIYASGPLWKNKVFFYGLYQLRDIKREDITTNGTQHLTREQKDPFWGVKVDILPFEGHRLEYTGFRDESRQTDTQLDYDFLSRTITGTTPAIGFSDRGGTTNIGRYTGTFMEKLTVSALWGKSSQNRTDSSSEDNTPFIYDGRSGSLVFIQGNPNLLVSEAADFREAMRFDVEYAFDLFGSHRLRAGIDSEDNLSKELSRYSGDKYYRYYPIPANRRINGAPVPDGATAAVRTRVYRNDGSFKVKSDAWYVEDTWTLMNDRLVARLGLRNESFENLNSQGNAFITVEDQMAPRLGFSYDLTGDQKTKIFFNWGRYHLPVASNTNVRLAGGEVFTEVYNVLTSVGADGKNPVLGAQIGGETIYSDGTIRDRREIVDMDIAPMYQDEWVIGVQHALTKEWSVGIRGTHRELDSTAMDDVIVDHALTAWAHRNGFPNFDAEGAHAYVLANPGRPVHMFWDFNENGSLDANEEALLTVEDLQYPNAQRKYWSVELNAEKVWNGKWSAQVSYTWAQSYGNYEGWVLSDNGQDDAGITQLFDSPLLTSNTYGKLPNDRRHQIKAFGAYAITPELTLGVNSLLSSGRPINKIGTSTTLTGGVNTTDPIAGNYGASYLLVPRGSAGTTDWQFRTDLSLIYRPKWGKDRLTVNFEIFNILNGDAVTEVVETAENAAGGVDRSYGLASAWQTPRYIRLSVGLDF